MGGLLLAEVVLLPSTNRETALKHRVLGTISFDTPFLGMHPGIIKSGLGSFFRTDLTSQASPTEEDPERPPEVIPSDPNFNPAFFNDNHLPVRTAWRNAAHFVNKHSNTLFSATKQMIASHIEFGGCLADYDGLKVRYCRLRMLEEDDQERRRTVVQSEVAPLRTRFANYYTASSGRPKKGKSTTTENPPVSPLPNDDPERERTNSRDVASQQDTVLMSTPIRPEKIPIGVAEEDSDDETQVSDLSDLDPLDDDIDSDFDDANSVRGGEEPTGPRFSTPGNRSTQLTSVAPTVYEPPAASFIPASVSRNIAIDTPMQEASRSEKPGPNQVLSNAALNAYVAEQAAMPPEPLPPGPPPSFEDYEDDGDYRQLLSDHGRASKTYFQEAQSHQKAQYENFLAESKERMDSYHAEIKKWNDMIVEESRRFAAGVAENARIVAEINREAANSRIEHGKLVAEYRSKTMPGTSAVAQARQSVSKAQQRVAKIQLKQAEREAKLGRRLDKHRERLEKKLAKVASKTQATTNAATSGARNASILSEKESKFFDAYDELSDPKEGSYDVVSAPIAETIVPLPSYSSSRTSLDTISRQTTSSQLSLDNASPTILSPQATNEKDALGRALEPKQRDKVFCTLPPADGSGHRDPTWVKIFMENMDEVSAHTGLFFPKSPNEFVAPAQAWSERYSKLVCDVAERIESWIGEEMTRRVVEEFGAGHD